MPSPDPLQQVRAQAPETLPYWEAALAHRFVLPTCAACGKAHWFPRAVCPLCASPRIEWREALGTGTLYSVTVVRRANPPYALAYVTLDEGPTMLTEMVDADLDRLAIGLRVKMRFRDTAGALPAPVFAPLED